MLFDFRLSSPKRKRERESESERGSNIQIGTCLLSLIPSELYDLHNILTQKILK